MGILLLANYKVTRSPGKREEGRRKEEGDAWFAIF